VQTYLQYATRLSKHWERPFAATVLRLLASRLRYGRGPQAFDKFRFIDKPLREWDGYASDHELLALEQRTAPGDVRHYDEDKLAFAHHCGESGLRTVPIVAVVVRKAGARAMVGKFRTATSGEELTRLLASTGDFDGFAKPRGAGQGYGAFGFTTRSGAVTTPAGLGTADDLFEACTRSRFARDGCYLLQPRILPHPALTSVMPGPGLGTVRILTFLRPDGDVVMPWATLKVPAPGAECDNLRFGSLVSAADVDTGRLRAAVGATSRRPVVHEMETHPETGARFADVRLPYWPEVIDLVTRAARAFEMLPVLGWDVAITADGPLLMETNWMFSIALPEMVLGCGLADQMRELWAQVLVSQR